jgi:hypothetical protein
MQPKPLGMGAPGGPQFKRGGKVPMKTVAKGGRAKGGGINNDMKKFQDHETDFTGRLPPPRGLAPYSGQDRAMEKGPPTGRESGRVIKPGRTAERDEDFKRGGKIPMKTMAKGGGRRAGGGGVGPDLSKVTNEPVGGNLKRWLRGEGPAPSATARKARKNASASDRYTVVEEGGISKTRSPVGGYRGAVYDAMEEGAAPVTGARRASPGEGALTGSGRTAASRSPGEGALTGSGRAAPAVRSAPRPAPRVSRPTAGEMEADRLMDKWNTKDGVLPGGIVPKDDVLRRGGRVKKGAK